MRENATIADAAVSQWISLALTINHCSRLLLFSPPSFNVAIMAEISELYRGAQKTQRQKTTVEMNTSFPSGLIYEVRVMRRFPMPPVEQMFYDSHVMSEVHDS